MAIQNIGWIFDFIDKPADGLVFNFWSGSGDLTFTIDGEDITYKGTNGLIKFVAPSEAANEAIKLSAELDATDPNIRIQLLRDLGPLKIRLRWTYQVNDTWILSSKQFIGRLSAPRLIGSKYIIDIESLISDLDRGNIHVWSHDTQRARFATDRAFEYLKDYKNGIDTKWPP